MPQDTPNRKKVAVGPLPPQKEDYSTYEETKILWGRLALVFGGVFVLAFAGLHALFSPVSDERVVSVIEQRRIAEKALLESQQAPQANAVVASVQEIAELESSEAELVSSEPQSPVVKDSNEVTRAASLKRTSVVEPVSAVTTLHPAIRAATLARDVDAQRQPSDILGYEVLMNGEDIIKVVLHTELQNLQGVTLYHEWHRGDKRYARVKIPVRAEQQGSYSSKFIDQHMTGEWSVQVRDEQGALYAMANFRVIR